MQIPVLRHFLDFAEVGGIILDVAAVAVEVRAARYVFLIGDFDERGGGHRLHEYVAVLYLAFIVYFLRGDAGLHLAVRAALEIVCRVQNLIGNGDVGEYVEIGRRAGVRLILHDDDVRHLFDRFVRVVGVEGRVICERVECNGHDGHERQQQSGTFGCEFHSIIIPYLRARAQDFPAGF